MSALVNRPRWVWSRRVKNLGWLLRHWKEVRSFEIVTDGSMGALLIAHLDDGQYRVWFTSYSVLIEWLDRPVFRGVSRNEHDDRGEMAAFQKDIA